MAVFAYSGTSARGEKLSGEIDATSRSEALRKLAMDRIQPQSLVAKADAAVVPRSSRNSRATGSKPGPAQGGVRLTNAQLILFTDELADFLNSGLQLEPALQLMENREEKSPVKDVSRFLRERVRDGAAFSDSLRVASPSFDELYCNLVGAGEVSGALAPLLRRQATHLVAMQELRGRIALALIYPAVLVLAGIGAMTIFMTVLVPQMVKLFAKTGAALPLPTYILIQLSTLTHQYGLVTLIAAVLLVGLFMYYIRQPSGRRWWDEAKLRVPLLGSLLSEAFYAQFCQTMSNLLLNGLPLITTLKLTSGATGNVYFRSLLLRITDLVGEGASLTRAMKSVGGFPANLRDLVKVGEQTGDLGGTLEKVGERHEKIIQMRIDKIMAIVPLVIIAALGLLVLLIAWSMLSGIFGTMKALQMHR
jgi:type II secretory pathway component PulF